MSVQTKELNNGRLAMIAIAAFVVQVGTQHFSSSCNFRCWTLSYRCSRMDTEVASITPMLSCL